MVYGAMDIDVWEVINAAKTKPFGFMPFYPGPGLGGHCIPIDPFYLTWKAKEVGKSTLFNIIAGLERADAGEVRVQGQAVKAGHSVQAGDRLSTGADGYVYIKTVDNGFLILRPNSDASIIAYQADSHTPANSRFKFELREGVARSISGQAVKNAQSGQTLRSERVVTQDTGMDAGVIRSGIVRYEKSYVTPPTPLTSLDQGLGQAGSGASR